ncbi:MAG: glycerol-3-phosphate acyltransferase [Clostridia bacterium]|nr:glycerol-3-phosphate acyltransferase [Clostridia bacterium]
MTLLIPAVVGYSMGSVSAGVIVGCFLRGLDIRDWGSGNTGGTNAARVLGLGPGLAVALLDIGKGALATVAGGLISGWGAGAMVGGAAAVVGHIIPAWFGFRGGKGLAVFFGACVILAPRVIIPAGVGWLLAFAALRSAAGASAVAAACLPAIGWATGMSGMHILYLAAMGFPISLRHVPDCISPRRKREPRRLS